MTGIYSWVMREIEWSFDGKLSQEYSYQKLLKSDNLSSKLQSKMSGTFLGHSVETHASNTWLSFSSRKSFLHLLANELSECWCNFCYLGIHVTKGHNSSDFQSNIWVRKFMLRRAQSKRNKLNWTDIVLSCHLVHSEYRCSCRYW